MGGGVLVEARGKRWRASGPLAAVTRRGFITGLSAGLATGAVAGDQSADWVDRLIAKPQPMPRPMQLLMKMWAFAPLLVITAKN